MVLQIGITKDDNNKINKTFTVKSEVNVHLKEETSIINPTFILRGKSLNELSEYNYIYVPDFKRFYFIENIKCANGFVYEINCSIDVLMSHKTEILALQGTVKRSENIRNAYIIDNEYKSLSYSNIVCKRFPNEMNEDNFILMTVG